MRTSMSGSDWRIDLIESAPSRALRDKTGSAGADEITDGHTGGSMTIKCQSLSTKGTLLSRMPTGNASDESNHWALRPT